MGDLVWDNRLMSRDEFWELAVDQPIRPGVRQGLLFLDCADCGQAVLPLGAEANPFVTSCERIAGAVLRHQVSAHDMPLDYRRGNRGDNRRADGAVPGDGQAAADSGGLAAAIGRHPASRRPAAEIRGRHRKPPAAGDDRA